MKNPDINSIDDLLANELFRKWIIEKEEAAAVFWSQWIDQNPARLEWVAAAKAIIETLTETNGQLTNHEINREADIIQQKLLSLSPEIYEGEEPAYLETYTDDGKKQGSKGIPFFRTRYLVGIAASLLMIAGIYWYY